MDDGTYGLSQPIDDPPAPPIPAGPIDDDLPCKHCGYNLRGLTEDRACPECGTAVARSLLDDRLRYSDPVWVRNLARGATWILTSVLLGFAIGIISFGLGLAIGISNASSQSSPTQASLWESLINLLAVIPSFVYLVGVWFITTPEPGMNETNDWNVRNVLRWAVVFSTAVSLISTGVAITAPVAAGMAAAVSAIIGLVAYILLFVYARRLALRVPDYELAKQTKTVMWGMLIVLIGAVLTGIIAAIAIASSAGAGIAFIGIPFCALGVAYLVFAIWSLFLLFRYRRTANDTALAAEQSWARDLTDLSPA